jgi:Uma2 family endonuclease
MPTRIAAPLQRDSGSLLPHPQVGVADADDVTPQELPAPAYLRCPVDPDVTVLEQGPDVRADIDHVGELEELPQPDRVCGDDNLAHPAIISRRPGMAPPLTKDSHREPVDSLGMTVVMEIRGWAPAGPLTAADLPKIDMEVPFEISDGKLEIMAPPSPWHQVTTRAVDQVLDGRYPATLDDVPLAVGDNGRRPDVLAVRLPVAEILKRRIQVVTPDLVEVAAEVISHDEDPWRDAVSVRRDRETKFREYAQVGIPEYWIVDEDPADPTDATVEIFHLHKGTYVPALQARLSELTSGSVAVPERPETSTVDEGAAEAPTAP